MHHIDSNGFSNGITGSAHIVILVSNSKKGVRMENVAISLPFPCYFAAFGMF